MQKQVELSKGWYWVLTTVHKQLAVRYFSGKHWRIHPGEVRPIREPHLVIRRIAEPKRYLKKQDSGGSYADEPGIGVGWGT